jgi:hypothetical protein
MVHLCFLLCFLHLVPALPPTEAIQGDTFGQLTACTPPKKVVKWRKKNILSVTYTHDMTD